MLTEIGDLIAGRYRVLDKLGEGSVSAVWLAHEQNLNKMFAIKEIHGIHAKARKAYIDRIRAETDLQIRLVHPGLPHVVEAFEEADSFYIVMKYVQGRDLLIVMKQQGQPFSEDEVTNWGIQLCDTLGYLHSQGIVHNDVKPGSIMLLDDDSVVLFSLGLARKLDSTSGKDYMPLGTRGYASPEAFQKGLQTDARSDIYSLGATLFHLATGHGPMEYVTQPTLPPIRMINPALSEGLEYVIIKATQWDPAARYQSCSEMMYDLNHRGELSYSLYASPPRTLFSKVRRMLKQRKKQ